MNVENIISTIIKCAWNVRNALPPGYLEMVYRNVLLIELMEAGLNAEKEVPTIVTYKGQVIGEYRMDLVVNKSVVVELKATEQNNPVYSIQLVNYLMASGIDNGLLINYGETSFRPIRKYRTYTPSTKESKSRTLY